MWDHQAFMRGLREQRHAARTWSLLFLTWTALALVYAVVTSSLEDAGAWMSWGWLILGAISYFCALIEAHNYHFWSAVLERAEVMQRLEDAL